jgi:hypothetical protein
VFFGTQRSEFMEIMNDAAAASAEDHRWWQTVLKN